MNGQRRIFPVRGYRNTTGDGTAIKAALGAGKEIGIAGYRLQLEEDATTAQRILLKGGETILDELFVKKGVEGILMWVPAAYVLSAGDNQPLYLYLAEAKQVSWTLWWYLID